MALALGEMSSVHPAAGSFGLYGELYLSDWAGFVARYGYWFSVVIAIGSELVAGGTYMRIWFPNVPVVIWMVVFGFLLLLVNLFSVGKYGTFEYWFALLKVVTIFLFILIGAGLLLAGKVAPQYLSNGGFTPNGRLAALIATSFGLYSFLGIEMVAISSGEARSGVEIARATRFAFGMLLFLYVGAMAVLVGVMPWRHAGVAQSPFVTVFRVAGIPAAGFIMNVVVLSAALSGANATLYVASRMLFSLARFGYAPKKVGELNDHGVPMTALLISMGGIIAAMALQLWAPADAYLYIINAALIGGMLAWLVSLAAHVRFRQSLSAEQTAALPLRAPLGGFGSIIGFVGIVGALAAAAWGPQARVTLLSAAGYLFILTVAFSLMRKAEKQS